MLESSEVGFTNSLRENKVVPPGKELALGPLWCRGGYLTSGQGGLVDCALVLRMCICRDEHHRGWLVGSPVSLGWWGNSVDFTA